MFTWILKQTYNLTSGLSLVSCEFSDAGTDSLDVGLMPHIDNLAQRSDSFWVYIKELPTGTDLSVVFGTNGYAVYLNSDGYLELIVTRTTTSGVWFGTAYPMALGQWYHVVVTIDNSSTTNDPIFYVDGTSRAIYEYATPSGTLSFQTNYIKKFGFQDFASAGLIGAVKDYRIYNRILSAGEVSTLNSEGAGGTGVSSTGLLFQGPCVRTRDLTYYTGHTMTADDRLIDNIYGVTGSATGSPVIVPTDMSLYSLTPASLDTLMYSAFPTNNASLSTTLYIGNFIAWSNTRSLLKFDLSSIPATDVCVSATLSLWLSANSAAIDAVWDFYRVLRNWTSVACWNTYSAGNNWATAGGMGAGDVDGTVIGSSATILANTPADTEIQIALDPTIIQGLWDGTFSNYGFLVKARAEDVTNRAQIYSSDHATVAYRPKLTILTQAP